MTSTDLRRIWLHGQTQDRLASIMRGFFTPRDTLIGCSTPSLGQASFPNGTLVPALYAAMHSKLDLLLVEDTVFERLTQAQRSNLKQLFAEYHVDVKSNRS